MIEAHDENFDGAGLAGCYTCAAYIVRKNAIELIFFKNIIEVENFTFGKYKMILYVYV